MEREEWNRSAEKAVAKLAADMVVIPFENFAMCKYEVTQALWVAVMGKNPSTFMEADKPVDSVSWNDCQMFIELLNALPEVKSNCYIYRLPSQTEWEFACRAGAIGDYCNISDDIEITKEISKDMLSEVAWYDKNSDNQTHTIGEKLPNSFGLYDMLGNVGEWTSTENNGRRLICGGSWYNNENDCKASNVLGRRSGMRSGNVGFRLAADKKAPNAD